MLLKFPIILSPIILKIIPWSDARYRQLNMYFLLLLDKSHKTSVKYQDTLIEHSL